jgi:beta-fructofuranosidase
VVVIFNMNDAKPCPGWNQIMSLPRKLTMRGRDEIAQAPAGDIESLRYDHVQVGKTVLPANEEVVLETVSGNTLEIIATIAAKELPLVEMNVLRSPGKEEFTRIAFFRERGYHNRGHREGGRQSLISLDTSYSSLAGDVMSRAPETAPVDIDSEEDLTLRVFIDRSVVEVFVNDVQCVAARVYPDRDDSMGVSFRSQGLDAELKGLDAWQMKSIYS